MNLFARCAFGLALLTSPIAGTTAAMAADVLVTSSGQALDAFTVKTLLGRAGIENDYDPVATKDSLEGHKTVIIAVGASVKGFGAAGITAETELARTKELLEAAEAADVKVIAVHIGGAERRQGLSEQFVQLVSNEADALVVWVKGNADGYFDKVAEERNVPLTVITKLPDVGAAISEQL